MKEALNVDDFAEASVTEAKCVNSLYQRYIPLVSPNVYELQELAECLSDIDDNRETFKMLSVFALKKPTKGTGVCVIKDDMAEVLQKMIDCDVLVLASPVYFYSIDAQLKAVIDRSVARWLEVKDKELYYIMTAADEEKAFMETTLACFRGYADCVEGAKEMGVIYGTGVYEKGKVKGTKAMQEAYEMGKAVS